jgi:hypothetical protein
MITMVPGEKDEFHACCLFEESAKTLSKIPRKS